MRGLVASVTSCIGGKEERFAVQVKPTEQGLYFVYKTMSEFEGLWAKLEAIAMDVKAKQTPRDDASSVSASSANESVSLMGKWLASFVDHYAFRATVQKLRASGEEVMSTLNVLLDALVRRVSALYVENTILRCGCCPISRRLALLVRNFLEYAHQNQRKLFDPTRQRKRQLSEVRPEDADGDVRKRTMPMFPMPSLSHNAPLPKSRKLSAVTSQDFLIPSIRKMDLNLPPAIVPATAIPGRRRVFAEVDISI